MKNNDFKNLYAGCLCQLKKEGYKLSLYAVCPVIVYRKKDGSFFDLETEKTYEVLSINDGHFDKTEEGLYFFDLIPYQEYLEEKETTNIRMRKHEK